MDGRGSPSLTAHWVWESGCSVRATGGQNWPAVQGARFSVVDRTHRQWERPPPPPASPRQPREEDRGSGEEEEEESSTERPWHWR